MSAVAVRFRVARPSAGAARARLTVPLASMPTPIGQVAAASSGFDQARPRCTPGVVGSVRSVVDQFFLGQSRRDSAAPNRARAARTRCATTADHRRRPTCPRRELHDHERPGRCRVGTSSACSRHGNARRLIRDRARAVSAGRTAHTLLARPTQPDRPRLTRDEAGGRTGFRALWRRKFDPSPRTRSKETLDFA